MDIDYRQKTDRYHHGSLRASLIDAGIDLLETGGEAEVSLRAVARMVGVSHNAPYRHFASKDELMAAVCTKGYRTLQKTVIVCVERASTIDTAPIYAATEAYVDFVVAHPALTELMLRNRASNRKELLPARLAAFDALVHAVSASGIPESADPANIALLLWATANGVFQIFQSEPAIPPATLKERMLSFLAISIGAYCRHTPPPVWPVSGEPIRTPRSRAADDTDHDRSEA